MNNVTFSNPCHCTFKKYGTEEVVLEGEFSFSAKLNESSPNSSNKEIDEYDALMRKKYLEMHRKMWNWIADETERTHTCVGKAEAFEHFGWRFNIRASCWCCQYMLWRRKYSQEYSSCRAHCLVDWGIDGVTGNELDCINDSLYDVSVYEYWVGRCNDDDWRAAATAARIIANLPERK